MGLRFTQRVQVLNRGQKTVAAKGNEPRNGRIGTDQNRSEVRTCPGDSSLKANERSRADAGWRFISPRRSTLFEIFSEGR
jgi:hypothetical protein